MSFIAVALHREIVLARYFLPHFDSVEATSVPFPPSDQVWGLLAWLTATATATATAIAAAIAAGLRLKLDAGSADGTPLDVSCIACDTSE